MGVVRFLNFTLLIAFGASTCLGQNVTTPVANRYRVLNEKGWDTLVDLPSFEVLSEDEVEIDGVDVNRTFYSVKAKPELVLANGSECELRRLVTFSIEERHFGIAWTCVGFGVDPRYGKFYLGCSSSYLFLDEDLDGRFEIRTIENDLSLPVSLKTKYGPPPPPRKKN
jgi:hypothetical protein